MVPPAMKIVPVIKCSDLKVSYRFYTDILGFAAMHGDDPETDPVIDLARSAARVQLSSMAGDSVFGVAINVEVDDVDPLFAEFLSRGLDNSGRENSPVHRGPIDQTWGSREFYVTDPDGNTLRFRSWPK